MTAADAAADPAGALRDSRGRRRVDESTARLLLLSATAEILRERGINGLTIAGVLQRTQLGTRVFYRNFSSKDDLVQAAFVQMALVETQRLRDRMSAAANPVHAIALWIACRLDLAFDPDLSSDLRVVSHEAQAQLSSAPQLISGAFDEMLTPLCEQIAEGRRLGSLPDVDPVTTARLIHGALWACTEFSWATGDVDRLTTTRHALTFCLCALGVSTAEVDAAVRAVTRTSESDG